MFSYASSTSPRQSSSSSKWIHSALSNLALKWFRGHLGSKDAVFQKVFSCTNIWSLNHISIYKTYFIICLCLCLSVYGCVCLGVSRGQKRTPDPLEPKSQAVVSQLIWVLQTEFQSLKEQELVTPETAFQSPSLARTVFWKRIFVSKTNGLQIWQLQIV